MRNVEAKFRLGDHDAARVKALAAGFVPHGELLQRDTFFITPNGKLKLREESADGGPPTAALIYYERSGAGAQMLSNYEIVAVAQADAMRAMLVAALGIRGEVRKCRTLLMRRNVRLHLDEVDGLGSFGEIEAVLGPADAVEGAQAEVGEILRALGVPSADLLDSSYFELMAPPMR
jgi:adenylate cyclase class 2